MQKVLEDRIVQETRAGNHMALVGRSAVDNPHNDPIICQPATCQCSMGDSLPCPGLLIPTVTSYSTGHCPVHGQTS